MRRITMFSVAKKDITSFFEQFSDRIFKAQDLDLIFYRNHEDWKLATWMSSDDFIDEMVMKTRLKKIEFLFSTGKLTRYIYGKVSLYHLALSLKPRSYFSHYTAAALHQLVGQSSKDIYVTFEQSPKHYSKRVLLQENIDTVFAQEQRMSKNHALYRGYKLYLLNGKHTNDEGVIAINHPQGGMLNVTNLERTLIDIAVRPAYSGGVRKVLKAYRSAKNIVSVEKLKTILNKIDFIYPYHQVIGFYMERAGYSESQLSFFKEYNFEYRFYLTYNIERMAFSEIWQLYYPEGF